MYNAVNQGPDHALRLRTELAGSRVGALLMTS
jgi:hypothetical protein